jgi:hypothetical protein
MKKTVFDFATGETTQMQFTAEELAEFEARKAVYVPSTEPPAPTKEQLLTQLNALSAQIQALE